MTATAQPSVEDLLNFASTAIDFAVRNPLPDDSSIDVRLRNYDGDDAPELDGLSVSVWVRTADADWVDGLRGKLFGSDSPEPEVDFYDEQRVTRWEDGWRCDLTWTAPLPTSDEPAWDDGEQVQDVLDDRRYEAHREARR